jgi:hypothetical protein
VYPMPGVIPLGKRLPQRSGLSALCIAALVAAAGCSDVSGDPRAAEGGWYTRSEGVEVVDDDGYSYRLTYEGRYYEAQPDITNAKPGEAYSGGKALGSVTLTNTTEGRSVPLIPAGVSIIFLYPRSGAHEECWPQVNIGGEKGYVHCIAGIAFNFDGTPLKLGSGETLKSEGAEVLPLLGTEASVDDLVQMINSEKGFTAAGLLMQQPVYANAPRFQLASTDSDGCSLTLLDEPVRGDIMSRVVWLADVYGLADPSGGAVC